jgi:hypothetical protein
LDSGSASCETEKKDRFGTELSDEAAQVPSSGTPSVRLGGCREPQRPSNSAERNLSILDRVNKEKPKTVGLFHLMIVYLG